VAAIDPSEAIKSLETTMSSIEAVVDLDKVRADIAIFEEQAAAPNLWDDVDAAQQVTSKLSFLQGELRKVQTLRGRIEDLSVMFELAEDENDADARAEADTELASVTKAVDEMEVRTLLSGEYDAREALVNIRAEAGGVDAADFAERLMRMYLRWAERHGYPTEVYDTSYAEEAGIKSATFGVKVPYAYGTLSVEQGTHRLVRISPFDNQGRRQTSFAGVEVLPVVEKSDHVDIDESELRVDVYRSSGPGGQGVNTTDSAVQVMHIPTGTIVRCQDGRSQQKNKEKALKILRSRLLERKQNEEAEKYAAHRKDQIGSGERSEKVRTYNYPQNRVTDHRVDLTLYNLDSFVEGNIQQMIDTLQKADMEARLAAAGAA
jgi:peptide chain release factor 2